MNRQLVNPNYDARGAGRSTRAAFTLVELVVSLLGATILVGGMASAIVLASGAVPDREDGFDELIDATAVVEQLSAELASAMLITGHSGRGIAFEVPDRDSDGTPETIRYVWSGNAGDPLRRRYNLQASVDVLAAVEKFELDYATVTRTEETSPASETESAARILAEETTNADLYLAYLRESNWIGQTIMPTLPADADGWRPTAITVALRPSGYVEGELRMRLSTAGKDGTPAASLAEATVHEKDLPAYATSFAFKEIKPLRPDQAICFTLEHIENEASGEIVARVLSAKLLNGGLLQSSAEGKDWSLSPGASLLYRLYGTTLQYKAADTVAVDHAAAIRIKVQTDSDAPALETTARMLNTPELN